ncbi:hypothetical protein MF672_020220 [Actinomadura sp. ATCC 31491]|uniref:Uncharacterized protein n=1 Tax=Actinomadura luzonensis TaxID=2805427 RepID=A0ABT0FUV1_9ACTN|nr:hypothetical protein [Actinomadura luzonensis]MCK2216107.1 hypothetical protein [Actinomadura luzonensis]
MIRLLNQQEDGGPDGDRPPPAPPPDLVRAARAHLSDRYATGVDHLFWQARGQPMPDTTAITEAASAALAGRAAEADLTSALVAAQALRLDVDRLEHRLLQAARAAGLDWPRIAAALGLPSAEAAERHHARLQRRARLPVDEVVPRHAPAERLPQARRRWQDLVTWHPQPDSEDGESLPARPGA